VPIPNGVDTSTFHPSVEGEEVRRRFQIPASAAVVGFVGALDDAHYFKRVDLLLQALAAHQNADLHALIVGDGELLPSFTRLARELAIQDRVHFAGGISHHQLPPYVTAMDMLVLPSDSVESFGMVLIEAMACGRPVIASNLPGVGSLLSPGQDGLLVPPGNMEALANAIREMANVPPERRREMGAAGRAKVEAQYSWERIGDRIEQLYFEMLGDRIPVHAS
jgi:glycosyltransferase involved in cell wall biosynthesis